MADLESEARNRSSGTTSEEDLSEVLDEDELGADFPPEEPVGVFEYGVTPQEERIHEPLVERVEREEPDFDELVESEREVGPAGRLVAPDEGVHLDDEATAIATDVDRVADHDLPVGDVGTGDTTTDDVATELTQDLSAEEAAVHIREVP